MILEFFYVTFDDEAFYLSTFSELEESDEEEDEDEEEEEEEEDEDLSLLFFSRDLLLSSL